LGRLEIVVFISLSRDIVDIIILGENNSCHFHIAEDNNLGGGQ
jgi:hypothetical protein